MKQRLLLHTCCAVCSAYVLEKLGEDYNLTVFYYNPNIHPKEEYLHRLKESKEYCQKIGVNFIEGQYDTDKWFELIKGHEQDPEKGERCRICYRMRMEETTKYAKKQGYDIFATTLTISPHKDAGSINKIGLDLEKEFGVKYLEADFKKQDGFKKTMELANQEGFYKQNYCGCVFSRSGV